MKDVMSNTTCCGQKFAHLRKIDYENERTIDIYTCENCGVVLKKTTNYIEYDKLAGTDD
jgi:predicted SprT family Zn-dependent metalloprotease